MILLFLHSREFCFRCLCFAIFGVDVVGGDRQVIMIDQFHFGAPAPVGPPVGSG